ncbi:hypothetical protein [Actinacidiphila oryziradicis]|uniref:Uncharacterized protein n=1 Tax=Actinacidiphila oryziradicis TaxID=2571141 RepID=A0A4U0SG37_9ACTN|nr:hypothetical protein [Actinacidiphila oryziradicis]TKA08564.1 hypothetical protein FCI23_26870 [Actinacidiphila oryziradicis]
MPRPRAALVTLHQDGTECPESHKHTRSGKPLHPECPGRYRFESTCDCGAWELSGRTKGYIDAERKRHLASHREAQTDSGPAVLRELLRFAD